MKDISETIKHFIEKVSVSINSVIVEVFVEHPYGNNAPDGAEKIEEE